MSAGIESLLAELRQRDIRLAVNGDDLAVDAPRGALQAGDLAQLRALKPQILAFLREIGARGTAAAAIAPAAPGAPLRLSPAQLRLWFGEQLGGAAVRNHLPGRIDIDGALDASALRQALDRIVARHAALRTRFVDHGAGVEQEIQAARGFALEAIDLAALPAPAMAAAVDAHVAAELAMPFALAAGPLIRGRLLRLAPDRHVLLVAMHHIVSDGWSLAVLARELGALYAAFAGGRDDPLPPLAIQYADYAQWQHARAAEPLRQAQVAWWVQHLAGAPAALELPTDRRRPALPSFHAGAIAVQLPAPLVARLQALARREDVTLFMLLHAAWAILLARLSGQDDVVIGVPVANRGRPELDGLIGFFVNTLALRVRVDADARLGGLLAAVRSSVLAGFAHQDAPFEQVVEALAPERSLGRSPVFQTLLALQNTPPARAELPGLDLRVEALDSGTTPVDLALSLEERDGGLDGRLVYATDLFDRETAQRWAIHLGTLLEAMAADAGGRIGDLPLLAAAQRHELLHTFNPPARDHDIDHLVHTLVAAAAARTPDATALECAGQRLTHGELEVRANQLAHVLQAHGVGPEIPVALCAERSLDLVVGLLAILKAGGVYVPLDPAYPPQRLAWLLEDAAPVLVLGQSTCLAALPATGVPQLALDDPACAEAPATAPDVPGLRPDHLAYVIYTSGSTGLPKGVMVEHRQLAVTLRTAAAELRFAADDVMPNLASHAFDISLLEVLMPLICGGACVLVPPATVKDPAALVAATHGASVFHAVPSLMEALLQHAASAAPALAAVRCLLVGGEAVADDLLQRLQARWPAADVVELYGPTEATLISSFHRACASTLAPVMHNIGRPFDRARLLVLDDRLALQPIGVVGEIHLGGDRVARGYRNRPALSAERFIADPFAGSAGARLYRTGDLGRWRRDGSIEYLGRNDDQVKIRGFRIELGEIEAPLRALAGVRDAAVLARADAGGDKRLVAYVVFAGEPQGAGALRAALAASLPEHLLPSAFVVLERLPLTSNGKLDRAALPAPDGAAVARRDYVAPEGIVEQALAAIWQDLLGVERVGRDDHFFELGGHSLLAVQVVARVRQRLGRELPLRLLFAQPTLAAVAQAAGAGAAALPPLMAADRGAPLPLSWSQQRLWFLDQLDKAAGGAYHMPVALKLQGALDVPALRRSLDRIVARHESLRTRFVGGADGAWQVIAAADQGLSLVLEDLSALDAATRAIRVREASVGEAQAPFELAAGPLLRARLLRLAADEHVLLFTMHHIVSDGWSMGVLVREVAALYAAFAAGGNDPLPALPIQYADYASWQREWLQGPLLEEQLAFWRGHLAGAPARLELPTDRPRPALQSYRGAAARLHLPAARVAQLKALGQRHGTTLFMTLLAGWSVLLSRWSGQADVVVGTPVANRPRSELEDLIGFFVNTLALRVAVGADTRVGDLLAQVKATTQAAVAHQDVPFEQVVETLSPQRSLSHAPLFQVMLSLNNTPGVGELALPGVAMTALPRVQTTTQFDLALALTEGADGVSGHLDYATDLFDAATVERLLAHWQSVLAAMVADDTQPVGMLPLLEAAERRVLLEDFNATAADYPHDALIHGLFEAQAARTPEAIAVVHGDEALTYAQLNASANRLAHHLRGRGVDAGQLVGICLDRGPDLIVALLAVLKAGAAYVPLDPAYPRERVAFMLADARAPLVIAHRRWLPLLADTVPTCCLEEAAAAIAQESAANPAPVQSARGLAYVIYTSGSTGVPKGVAIEHRSAVALLHWARDAFTPAQRAGMLVATSICFDLSVFEIFLPLSWGDRGIVVENVLQLPSLPASAGVTLVNTVPSAMAELVRGGGLPASVRMVALAGEPLQNVLAQAVYAAGADAVFNLYGPSEDTTYSTWSRVERGSEVPVNIGRPVANTRAYVLDAQRQPVPLGVAGELYLGGDGLARGYLHRPELTAERFVNDPFGKAGERLYRTGDLVRYRHDGNLEYLGRLDHQVKIRGYRIELGEIEAALLAQPGVDETIVVARADGSGGQRLVAYTGGATAVDAAMLREQLRTRLPEYMVPALYVHLPALPQTPNGKIDRAALPAPGAGRTTSRAPATATEHQVAALWCELLGVDAVGAEDNFFDLGGHSLLAMRAHGRLRAATGSELPLRALFESTTLADYCSWLDRAATAATALPAPVVEGTPVPASYAQEAAWLLHQVEGGSAANTIAAAVQIDGDLDHAALQAAFAELVRRHAVLRSTFHFADGSLWQRVQPAFVPDLPMLDAADDATIAAIRRAHASAPFDLENGPLLRLALLAHGPQRHELLVAIHHIAADAGSVQIILAEIHELHAARRAGRTPVVADLPWQYADFAAWERRQLAPATLHARLQDWTRRMQPLPPTLDLRPDRARPARRDFAGATRRTWLDAADFAALRQRGQDAGATPFMVLMAAFAIVLHDRSGQTDITVGAPVAQRPRCEFDALVGFFVGTLVVRSDLALDPSFAALLGRVRAATLDAHEQADLPFQSRVDALALASVPALTPLFQTWLNYVPAAATAATGLRITDDAITVAKYDLMLTAVEDAAGLRLDLTYSTALFDAASADALLRDMQAVLHAVIFDGAQPLSALVADLAAQRRAAQARIAAADRSSLAALAAAAPNAASVPRRRATVLTAATLVRESALFGDDGLARLLDASGSPLDLLAWFAAERARIERLLPVHGAVLLRGFAGVSVDTFNALVGQLGRPLPYVFRSTPRSQVAAAVYTSTDYPASEWIPQHNENAYAARWPLKLAFHCVIAAETGGATPLADSRRVHQALDPVLRARFAGRGVMYVRNFGHGVDLGWQEAFQTDDRDAVDRYCAGAGIVAEWLLDGGLRTRNVCPAERTHPQTGEPLWFNQAHLFHISALAPELGSQLLDAFGADGVPRNAFYGDGEPIEDATLAAIRAAYAAHTHAFRWQAGDVLLVDNMACTHGREPYTGARRIVVGMADASDAATE